MKQFIKNTLRSSLLNEGRLKLTPEDMEMLNSLIPKYIEVFKNYDASYFEDGKKALHIATYNYKMANNEDAVINFWVQYTTNPWKGWFTANDKENLKDQTISLNFNYYSAAFKPMLFKIFKSLTGMDGTEEVRETIYHEMIHAKDPARNNHHLNEPYDSSKPEIYYASWAEFATMTGQFMESIVNKVNDYMANIDYKNIEDAKKKTLDVAKILQNILDYYAVSGNQLSMQTKYFIEDTNDSGMQFFMKKVVRFGEELLGQNVHNYQINHFINALARIKKYNPEGFKEFHKDLYLTIQECVEKLNAALVTDDDNTNLKIRNAKIKDLVSKNYWNDNEIVQPTVLMNKKLDVDAYNKPKPFISVGGKGSFKNLNK